MNNKERVLKYGIEVFNNEEDKFSNWLLKPNFYFGGKIPNELIETEDGIKQVEECLTRIEYGIFS